MARGGVEVGSGAGGGGGGGGESGKRKAKPMVVLFSLPSHSNYVGTGTNTCRFWVTSQQKTLIHIRDQNIRSLSSP